MDKSYKIKGSIIYAENKRAIKNGLMWGLTQEEFNCWCIDWWLKNGLDENNNWHNDGCLRDPYTGLLIDFHDEKSKLILEHIIPINRGGGTVIFNVVPSRSDVNSRKQDNDPIDWWLKSGFFSKERFKVFVNYVFSAYDKRINNCLFKLDTNSTMEENESYDDNIEELDNYEDDEEYKIQYKKNNNHQLKKINYGEFLSSCIVLLESIDIELGNYYSQKLKKYENEGIFDNISLYQQIQSIIFNQILKLDSSKKYEFLKKINMDRLIKSLTDSENKEEEIYTRISKLKQLIQDENSCVSLNDLLFAYPDIICISSEKLIYKINIIKNCHLGQDVILAIKNNNYLLSIPEKNIPAEIERIRESLGEEYFNVFINTSLQYDDIKVLNYIKNCIKSSQLKNLNNQESEDNLSYWLNKNSKLPFKTTFINTLSLIIASKSYKYTCFNGTIKQSFISKILTPLYDYVKNNPYLLNQPEVLKELIYKLILNISDQSLKQMRLYGDDINNQKKNLFDLFSNCVENNIIQNYLYLELIKNKKLQSLEKIELAKDVDIVKKYLQDAKNLNDLSLERLNLITKKLPNIGLLNGNFATRVHQKLVYIKNYDTNENEIQRLYISKKDISLITERLLKMIDFNQNVDDNFLKNTIKELIREQTLNNSEFFKPLNQLEIAKKVDYITNLFYKEVDSNSLQKFLLLEQILRQKREELLIEKNQKQIDNELQKQNNRINEIQKIIYYIDHCTDINQLRFENINNIKSGDKISLNEWINLNIDLEVLKINNLNRSFEKSLIDKIRSGSGKYSKKNIERKLISIVIEELNYEMDFSNKNSKEEQKKIVRRIISIIANNNDLKYEFSGYKGETLQEKVDNFTQLINKFIENGTIEIYLLLDQKVKQKKKQFCIDNQNSKFKRSA